MTENNEVSSANVFTLMIDHWQDHIYIYSSSPSMEPPAVTSANKEVPPLSTTICFLFLKKLNNRFKRLPDMLFFFSLYFIKVYAILYQRP